MARKRTAGDGTYRERTIRRTNKKTGDVTTWRGWECRFQLPNGKRKSVYGPTLESVKVKRAGIERDTASGLDMSKADMTVREYMAHWLDTDARHNVRTRTFEAYTQLATTHIYPSVGGYRLSRLTVQHVVTMMNDMVKEKGLSPSTAQRARAVLRICLKQAYTDQLVTRNVASLAKAPRSTATRKQPLTPEQTRRFMDTTRTANHPHWSLFTLAACTGMRAGELYGLRWKDVDLDAGILHIRQTIINTKGGWQFSDGKTRSSLRAVPLMPEAIDALRMQRKNQNITRLASGGTWADHGLIFTNSRGNPLNASNVNRSLHEALESCDLPRHGLHIFRHGCATMLRRAGVPESIIMAILGHTVAATTRDYQHADVVELMGEMMKMTTVLKTA